MATKMVAAWSAAKGIYKQLYFTPSLNPFQELGKGNILVQYGNILVKLNKVFD